MWIPIIISDFLSYILLFSFVFVADFSLNRRKKKPSKEGLPGPGVARCSLRRHALLCGCLGWSSSETDMGMGQYLLIPFLVGWTSIYQLFWGSLGTRVLTHPHIVSDVSGRMYQKLCQISGRIYTDIIMTYVFWHSFSHPIWHLFWHCGWHLSAKEWMDTLC